MSRDEEYFEEFAGRSGTPTFKYESWIHYIQQFSSFLQLQREFGTAANDGGGRYS